MGLLLVAAVLFMALLGTPLFAIMGGSSELLWLSHENPDLQFLRFIAPNVMEEKFAGSPILVTIPLFTFVGYLMAESKAPDRIVRASSAFFGWMPGGLAIVAIVASSFFTTLTGGSGVTIVAIGGLLYPALRKQGYPEQYALGLVTTGGSLGLLLPPSLPILVYALVAGIDFKVAFKAGVVPGVMIMVFLAIHAVVMGIRHNVPRSTPKLSEMGQALWLLKWELGVPVVILGGLGTGLTGIDESAALTAVYVIVVECFIHKDLSFRKDLPRVAKASMALAGALIMILSMANALINYVIDQKIPAKVLEKMLGLGLTETWQFLVVLNIFLLVLGMLMEGFSAILVAVPLVLPFAARFGLHPFHLAIMFLLNLEIAYVAPPLGLNLFIASFRFDRPLTSLYRVVMPFTGILAFALFLVMYVPKISTFLIEGDIAKAYQDAAQSKLAPREAWLLSCVQEDRSNPLPCSAEDKAKFGEDGQKNPYEEAPPPDAAAPTPSAAASADPPSSIDDELLKAMLGAGSPSAAPSGSAAPADSAAPGGSAAPAGSAAPTGSAAAAPAPDSGSGVDDDLLKAMLAADGPPKPAANPCAPK
jgi:C4-dicarboxylate transporter DctM subunit